MCAKARSKRTTVQLMQLTDSVLFHVGRSQLQLGRKWLVVAIQVLRHCAPENTDLVWTSVWVYKCAYVWMVEVKGSTLQGALHTTMLRRYMRNVTSTRQPRPFYWLILQAGCCAHCAAATAGSALSERPPARGATLGHRAWWRLSRWWENINSQQTFMQRLQRALTYISRMPQQCL